LQGTPFTLKQFRISDAVDTILKASSWLCHSSPSPKYSALIDGHGGTCAAAVAEE
jgi:hypothetical protein